MLAGNSCAGDAAGLPVPVPVGSPVGSPVGQVAERQGEQRDGEGLDHGLGLGGAHRVSRVDGHCMIQLKHARSFGGVEGCGRGFGYSRIEQIGFAGLLEPGYYFATADQSATTADAIDEDLGPAAGQAAESGVAKSLQDGP